MNCHLQLLGMTINFYATLDEIIIGESNFDFFIGKDQSLCIIRKKINAGTFIGLRSLMLHEILSQLERIIVSL